MQFEFHIYRAPNGDFLHSHPEIEVRRYTSDAAAKSAAGRLAKRHDGPVDLARAGGADWAERYMTTANPSEYHAAGYRFERLA